MAALAWANIDAGSYQRARPTALEEARAISIEAMVDSRPLESDERTIALIDAAERAGEAGDRDLHIELLWLVAVRTMWTDPGEAMPRVLADAARRLGNAQAEDPRVVAIYAYADPFGHAPEVVVRLRAALASGGHNPEPARHFDATLPYTLSLAGRGVAAAIADDPGLAAGVNVASGRIIHPAVAAAHGESPAPLQLAAP